MTVKVQLEECRDRRHKKKVTVSNIDKHILFSDEADSTLLKTMDGAKYAYFNATITHDPEDKKGLYNAKDNTKINLNLRLSNQGW